MALMEVMTTVSKETYELGEALVSIVSAMNVALADGWQLGSDLPVAVTALLANIGEITEGIKSAKGEWEEDEAAMIMAMTMTVSKLVKELRGQP